MSQNIYFDESGFTGNNLLHPEQDLFVYASVATNDSEARATVERLITNYGIQGDELKGARLLKYSRGRKAIDELLTLFVDRLKISVSNKKFALACKLHEYIFEPAYPQINSLLYRVGFHRFLANYLYLEFVARSAGAEEIFRDFEDLMRKGGDNLHDIFSTSLKSTLMAEVRDFAKCRASEIKREVEWLHEDGSAKWILDLTETALFTLLAQWGAKYDEITAVCDPSAPLKDQDVVFTAMLGRTDRIFTDVAGDRHPISFNLSEPIRFCDSKTTHGIQIADAVAAAAAHAFSSAADEHATRWRKVLEQVGLHGCILPDLSELNVKSLCAQRNALILLELSSRARAGLSLTDGMADFLESVSQRLLAEPLVA